MNKIKIGIIGVGNCCSSLLMGLEYYNYIKDNNSVIPGIMNPVLGGYKISDIEVVSGFDIDSRKVGKDISEAIFSSPNNTKRFSNVHFQNVIVNKGPILDGIADHMHDLFQVDESQKELTRDQILNVLKESKTQILINYLPVASDKATKFWAEIALDSKVAFINAIPIFIGSDPGWAKRFGYSNIPVLGDDIKSQCGSTILNRYLVQMLVDRGATIDSLWQTNFGGNTDFANMTDPTRLKSKKISKTESVSSLITTPNNTYVYAGPNGYIQCLKDNKVSHTRIDFKIFGNIDCSIDCKLSVEDSPNSGGIMVDAIRIAKLAIDRGIGGPLLGPSGWMFKHPPIQYPDSVAKQMTEDFINDIWSISQHEMISNDK